MIGSNKFGWLKHPGYNYEDDVGQQTQQTQTVQKADPWGGVQPYLLKGYQNLNTLYDQPGPFAFPGQTTAGPDPLRQQAQQFDITYANQGAVNDVNKIGGAYDTLLNAPNVNNNPYLQQAVQGAIRPMVDQFSESVLPGIRSGAMQTGQYGGSRQGIAEGIAAGKLSRNIGDVSSQMYGNAYQQGMDSLSKAMLFGPQMLQLGQYPSQILRGVAQERETAGQANINDQKRLFDYYQNLPNKKLSDYLTQLQGAGYGSKTSTETAPASSYEGNSTLGTIGGALTLGSLGTGLYNQWNNPKNATSAIDFSKWFS